MGRADRNLEGVRKCILHAVWQAQGQGCAPGALGVCIGSDRAHGYDLAKGQLFRTLDDVNPNPVLAKLEAEIMEEANKLGVGAMGFGGKASLIGCKITAANRLPASFFVSVAYECWAFRRLGVRLDAATGAITEWLYRDPSRPVERMARGSGFTLTGREVVLTAPLTEAQVRSLKVGDLVLINGEMFTGRDNVHAYLMKNPPPVDMNGSVLYHCGPVMLKQGEQWVVKAAGPTTSIREEPYQADVIKKYGVRAVIGKGGMGAKTSAALKEFGAVYLNAIGGAAQYYARTVEKVLGVELMEFGIPEAMWHLRVKNFAAIVTMDAHGNSLHADVEKSTGGSFGNAAESIGSQGDLLRPSGDAQFRNGFAIFPRVGRSVVYAGRVVAHHGLPSAERIRETVVHREFVAFGLEFRTHIAGNAIFQIHIASGERQLRESRRFERCLNVLIEVDDVRHKLSVRLRLVPSAHDAERNANLILLHECRNNCVQRAFVPRERIRRSRIQIE